MRDTSVRPGAPRRVCGALPSAPWTFGFGALRSPGKHARSVSLVSPLLVILGWVGCAGTPAETAPTEVVRPSRMVLVLVDTLRRDRLGIYGHGRPTSPTLDHWAESGTVFTEARAPSPWTLPSARALFGAGVVEAFDPADTVPVHLQRAGWQTASLVANPNLTAEFGFHAGWDAHHLDEGASAAAQVDRALTLLDAHAAGDAPPPLFLFLHLMDPHLPYDEGPAHQGLFAGEAPTPRTAGPLQEPALKGANALRPLTPEELRYLGDRYDQNVHAVDAALARLLPRLGPDDLVVVTSDHGEALGEHGEFGHGQGLTEEQVAIPLVVRGPGWSATRSPAPVGLDDVGATLLAAAGVGSPAGASGRDLLTLLASPPEQPRPQRLSHTHYGPARVGVVQGTDKRVGTATEVRRFDLGLDPGEAAPRVGPWTPADRAAWVAAGGAPLRPVLSVRLSPLASHQTSGAPGDIRGVMFSHPAGLADIWWPPALLRAAAPRRELTPTGLGLVADGPFAMPAELWLAVSGEGPVAAADLSITVSKAGAELTGAEVPGLVVAPGWAPPPMPHIPLGLPADATVGALQRLGYLEGGAVEAGD